MSALAGCASPEEGGVRPGGVLTIGIPESGVNGPELGIGSVVANLTLEGLTQVNVSVDGRALPRLAESWTWENDGRRLRLKLREDVVFHDGTALTAPVVAEALRIAIARPGNSALYPALSDVTAVHADGPTHLVVDLSQPSAFLPEELDLPLSFGPQNVGTGAFRMVSRDADGAVLERFDRYYLGAPAIERVVIRPFDTQRTAWTSLLRGEVDMVTDVPPEAIAFIRNDDIQVVPFPRSYQFLIAFNSQRPPFTSPAVRRALNVAVNRNALIADVLRDEGQPATGPIWHQHWAYDTTIPPYTFDPAFAAALLNAAGFTLERETGNADRAPSRLRFTCLLPAGFSLQERIGLDVQKQLFDVGVDVQFEVVTLKEYDVRIREGRFEAVLIDMSSGPSLARPNVFWGAARREGLHAFGYDNAESQRLFEVLRTSRNEASIRSATRRLQGVLLDDPPALFLAWNSRARAISHRFQVAGEPGRDPLLTIRQWTENSDGPVASTQ